LIDISVPRNIEPKVNDIDNVYLYNIDDLQTVVAANIKEREREAGQAEEIISEEVETTSRWLKSLEVVPTIVALKNKAEEIRRSELEKSLSRLGRLTETERQTVEVLTSSIINKLLHAPLVSLKHEASSENGSTYIEAARRLFNLDKDIPRHNHKKWGEEDMLKEDEGQIIKDGEKA
ncbi:MAG: glutamyl-tRNA reductase, partial [Nitrospirota bacterium]